MRVASATGSPLGGDSDLMREVNAALRDGPHQPTVVQSIQTMTTQMMQRLDVLVRQGGGHAAGPPAAGHGGSPEMDASIHDALLRISQVLDRIERVTATTERTGGGERSRGYFSTENGINAISIIRRMFQTEEERQKRNDRSFSGISEFSGLLKQEAENSVKNLGVGFLNLVSSAGNLQSSFRRLEQHIKEQISSVRETGVSGSNALNPMEFFLEGFTRIQKGTLLGFDSFRTSLQLVRESLEHNLISPLTMTGRSVDELAGDLHQARENMRERYGFDTRAWMSTQDANKAMSELVDLQQKFGVNATIRDMRTEMAMARDGNFLKVISANTGETVAKLETSLQQNRQEQDVLIGMGRMNETEFKNFTANQVQLTKMFGKDGESMSKQLAGFMRYGRTANEVIATAPPEIRTMAATLGPMFNQMMHLSESMMHNQLSPEQLRGLLKPMASAGASFTGMNAVSQNVLFPGQMDNLARMAMLGRQASAQSPAGERIQQNQQDSPTYALLQHATEIFQEMIKPFMRMELGIAANTAAIFLNIAAMGRLASAMMMRGGLEGAGGLGSTLMRGASTVARVGGPLLAGAGSAYAAYAEGAPTAGIVGGGLGGLGGTAIGAAIGSAIMPVVGTTLGMVIGGFLGGMGGQKAGTALSEGSRPQAPQVIAMPSAEQMAGPARPQVALAEQTAADTSALVNILSRILTSTETEIGYLAQIKGELSRQTTYLTGTPTPAGASAVGTGLTAPSVSSVQSRGSRADGSTAYSGAM